MTAFIQVDISIKNYKFVISVIPFMNVVSTLTITQLLAYRSVFGCEDFVYLLVGYITSRKAYELFSVHIQDE